MPHATTLLKPKTYLCALNQNLEPFLDAAKRKPPFQKMGDISNSFRNKNHYCFIYKGITVAQPF